MLYLGIGGVGEGGGTWIEYVNLTEALAPSFNTPFPSNLYRDYVPITALYDLTI